MPANNNSPSVRYAGFGIRTAAYLFDGTLSMVLCFLIEKVTPAADVPGHILEINNQPMTYSSLIAFFVIVGYGTLFNASKLQATPGKYLLGLKVTTVDGQRIGLLRSLGRFVAYWFDWMTLGFGFLMTAFTERKRALHDYVAGTVVVYR